MQLIGTEKHGSTTFAIGVDNQTAIQGFHSELRSPGHPREEDHSYRQHEPSLETEEQGEVLANHTLDIGARRRTRELGSGNDC